MSTEAAEVPETAAGDEPRAKRARTEDEVPEVPEMWNCVICHEDFPTTTQGFTAIPSCKHPICVPCFRTQNVEGRRKCDLCHQKWITTWVLVETRSHNAIVVPTYGGTTPRFNVECICLTSDNRTSTKQIKSLRGEESRAVADRFPFPAKHRDPAAKFAKITERNRECDVEIYPVSDKEHIVFLFRRGVKPKEISHQHGYNIVYLNTDTGGVRCRISHDGGITRSTGAEQKGKVLTVHIIGCILSVINSNDITIGHYDY